MSNNGYASITSLTTPMDRRFKDVEHPRFGKWMIQTLNNLERSRFESRIQIGQLSEDRKVLQRGLLDIKEQLIVLMVVDPETKLNALDVEHVSLLQKQDSEFIDWLATECSQFAGFSDQDIEGLAKNL